MTFTIKVVLVLRQIIHEIPPITKIGLCRRRADPPRPLPSGQGEALRVEGGPGRAGGQLQVKMKINITPHIFLIPPPLVQVLRGLSALTEPGVRGGPARDHTVDARQGHARPRLLPVLHAQVFFCLRQMSNVVVVVVVVLEGST